MPNLADLNIGRCERCGKLFKLERERAKCQRCEEEESQGQAVRPLREIPKGISGKPLASEEDFPLQLAPRDVEKPEVLCVRCAKVETVEGSEFCLRCTLNLYRALGDAAEHLFTSLEYVANGNKRQSPMSVAGAFFEKRARAATSRINPVGAVKIR